jgi:hypothetical protein
MSEQDPQVHETWIETNGVYTGLLLNAFSTTKALAASWRRTKRHNRAIERDALFSSILLDAACRAALADGRALPSPATADIETRYDVHAAIHTVHAVLPFTLAERDRLTPPEIMRNERFEDESAEREPRLFERWHEWLWLDDLGVPQTSTEALGASAILQEGCNRLSISLPKVMEGIEALLDATNPLAPDSPV